MTDTDELRISDEARADLAEAVLAVGSNEHAARFLRAEAATPWTNALAQVDAVLAAALPLIESELRAEVERLRAMYEQYRSINDTQHQSVQKALSSARYQLARAEAAEADAGKWRTDYARLYRMTLEPHDPPADLTPDTREELAALAAGSSVEPPKPADDEAGVAAIREAIKRDRGGYAAPSHPIGFDSGETDG